MRRLVTIALTLSLLLALNAAGNLLAQDEKKDSPSADAPKPDAPKDAPKADEPKDAPKAEPAAPAEEPLPTIPPEVEAKLEAARRAVAEAIVAAQDAGLVESSIDPPPVLDILITGRALDERQLKKALDQKDLQVGVSPEVFGAWYTGYGKTQGIVAQKNVRIMQPSQGLKAFYDQRSAILNSHINAVRQAKGGDQAKPDEPKPEEPKADTPKDEPKPDEPKAEAPKADEPKDEPKADEPE